MAADRNNVSPSFCYAGGDDAHAGARDQFDSDAGVRIHRPQVVDQLFQVFNAVDVMMRRGRNQHRIRHRMPQARDVRRHLACGKLAAFAGLRALRDLDF